MSTPLIPQEIYLLERFSSLDYFGQMRDAWAEMVDVAEQALEQFMHKLPPDYRRRHLSLQPDIVWGERVLPNFRSTLESLNTGYSLLAGGDLSILALGGNVKSDIKGQSSDYSTDWMPKEFENRFWHLQAEAGTRASNISFTEEASWNQTELSSGYHTPSRGPLDAPPTWPIYRLNASVTVLSGMPVAVSGIYLPASAESCAEVLIESYDAFHARISIDPKTGHNVSKAPTTWTLVERMADEGGGIPGHESASAVGATGQHRVNVPGRQTCPQSGWWFTPAKAGSRRYFKAGEVMPSVESSSYGATFWQWETDQAAPEL